MTEVVTTRKFRSRVPESHQQTLDTRLAWLWNQRFGTVQSIWQGTDDILDKTAATMILQAIVAGDLNNIALVFKRLEGGPQDDTVVLEGDVGIVI